MNDLNPSRNLAVRLRAGCFFAVLMLGVLLTASVPAQTFTTLYSFTLVRRSSSGVFTNSDGANPVAGLSLSSNTLYGTVYLGGRSGNGTVFAVNTSGTGFTNLHSFGAAPYDSSNYGTNSDGANPHAALVPSGNTLYGTASGGGSSSGGTVFAVNTDGTGFTNLHSFIIGSDGTSPQAGLILSGNTLYGTAVNGAPLNGGTVFKVNTDGTEFSTLHSFSWGSDGANPQAGLILSGNTLYGTAEAGGVSSGGTVFALSTHGAGFTTLHSFRFPDAGDGAFPDAGLVLSGNRLYGTAHAGGSSGNGTVFAVNTDGTGFTNLHNLSASSANSSGVYTNTDGVAPHDLVLSGKTLYGTAAQGGSSGNGTVFAVNTDGTGFTNLHNFTAGTGSYPNITNSDGVYPAAGLVLSANTLYGTTQYGGSSGMGTVFSLALPLPPQLAITPSGASVTLTWPTNVTGFSLQSTTNLGSSAFWTANSPTPVVVNGQNTVTIPISGTRWFFRLSQ